MSLLSFYQAQIKSKALVNDSNQIEVIKQLDKLMFKLERESAATNIFKLLYYKLFGYRRYNGFYLYSGVGRGKTMLMDMFFNNLVIDNTKKYRVHFHLFMKSIHELM